MQPHFDPLGQTLRIDPARGDGRSTVIALSCVESVHFTPVQGAPAVVVDDIAERFGIALTLRSGSTETGRAVRLPIEAGGVWLQPYSASCPGTLVFVPDTAVARIEILDERLGRPRLRAV